MKIGFKTGFRTVFTFLIWAIPFCVLAAPKAPPAWFEQITIHVSKQVGLDADLIKAVAWVESAYDRNAVSYKGASGLMQLMPATARELGVNNVFNPHQNVMGGATYLKQMIIRFKDVRLALIAYNCGPNATEKGRIPKESREYAQNVINSYYHLKKLGG